jgi:hypothetical protein
MNLYQCAVDGFKRYDQVWEVNNFWKRANTFDAFLNFASLVLTKWPPSSYPNDHDLSQINKERNNITNKNYTYLLDNIQYPGNWADDYGWWGIAALRARDYRLKTDNKEAAEAWLRAAQMCWQRMYDIGYDSRGDTFAAKPVPHGYANISQEGRAQKVDGTKNTVTNANFLVMSLQLYSAIREIDGDAAKNYLRIAYSQYKWFSDWFGVTPSGEPSEGYLPYLSPHLKDSEVLALERPWGKPDYTPDNSNVPTEPGCVWTGDQGLLLEALTRLLQVKNDLEQQKVDPNFNPSEFETSITGLITKLLAGVKRFLFWSGDNVLREPPFGTLFGANFGLDYVGGRGVLLRYLSQPNVRAFLKGGFDDLFEATAEAAWNSRKQDNNQFTEYWNKPNDETFATEFKKTWGFPHKIATEWELEGNQVDWILQAMGLDALAAVISNP